MKASSTSGPIANSARSLPRVTIRTLASPSVRMRTLASPRVTISWPPPDRVPKSQEDIAPLNLK